MHPIPRPEVLDAGRTMSDEREDMSLDEHRSRARELADALEQATAYGITLWEHLDAARTYLFESLPSDPRRPGPEPRSSAAPTGPDDRRGWDHWITTYAAVTSVLAGPHGDSGFGLSEARKAAEERRHAPNLRLLADRPETAGIAAGHGPRPAAPEPVRPKGPSTVRSIALGVLAALAVRGVVAEGRLRFGRR